MCGIMGKQLGTVPEKNQFFPRVFCDRIKHKELAMKYNITNIAKQAGVSKSTVSRVLNNHQYVREDTRKKILKVMSELDFQPNTQARNMVVGKTRTIGILIPNMTSSFYIEILEGVLDSTSNNEYSFLVYKSEDKDESLLQKVFHHGRIDGIIAITARFREQSFVETFNNKLPFVLINHRNTEIDAPYVCFDNFKGGYMATEFLINLGHKRIGCFTGRLNHQSTKDRYCGYVKAMEDAGLPIEQSYVRSKGVHFENSVLGTLTEWHEQNKIPTSIFAYNDLTAIEITSILRDFGLKVPNDVSVIGFDDIKLAELNRPPLTTIQQSMKLIGIKGAQMLFSLIEGVPLHDQQVSLEPKIIVRETCDKPKKESIL